MNKLIKSTVKFVDTKECPHSYFLDDTPVLGLTSLLKKHGITKDYSNINKVILKNATDRGTQVHSECEDYDDFGIEPTHEWAIPYVSLKLKVIASEFLVNFDKIVATQIDKILDDYSVCDIKTSSKIDELGVKWQCSIGAYLLEKQCNIQVPHIYLIHLRDGNVDMRELERISDIEIEQLFNTEVNNQLYCIKPTEVSTIDITLQNAINEVLVKEKELSERKKLLTEQIKDQMEEYNIKSIDNDLFKVTYISPTTKTTFDSKKALEDNPELAIYNKTSDVKSSIRITLKK